MYHRLSFPAVLFSGFIFYINVVKRFPYNEYFMSICKRNQGFTHMGKQRRRTMQLIIACNSLHRYILLSLSFLYPKFKGTSQFCDFTDWFVYDPVEKPGNRFSRDEYLIIMAVISLDCHQGTTYVPTFLSIYGTVFQCCLLIFEYVQRKAKLVT